MTDIANKDLRLHPLPRPCPRAIRQQVQELLSSSFAPDETRDLSPVFALLDDPEERWIEAHLARAPDGRVVGVALHERDLLGSCSYLWFMAVAADSRSRGIGRALLQHLRATRTGPWVCEIRAPQGTDLLRDDSEQSRRARFYAAAGFAALPVYEFGYPWAGEGQPGVEYLLLSDGPELVEPGRLLSCIDFIFHRSRLNGALPTRGQVGTAATNAYLATRLSVGTALGRSLWTAMTGR